MDPKNNVQIPTFAKWLLGIIVGLFGMAYVGLRYGYELVLVGIMVVMFFVKALPLVLAYFVIVGLIGAVVSQNRGGTIGAGARVALFYGLLGLLVFLIVGALITVSNGGIG